MKRRNLNPNHCATAAALARDGRRKVNIFWGGTMRLATSEQLIETQGLGAAFERWLRPAVGFGRPSDVLKDPALDLAEKRAVLASWASDASSVRDEPHLRWLLGAPEPVPLADIREALAKLDLWEESQSLVDGGEAN